MSYTESIEAIFGEAATIAAIASLTYFAHLGSVSAATEALLIAAIAGLGGYSLKKRSDRSYNRHSHDEVPRRRAS